MTAIQNGNVTPRVNAKRKNEMPTNQQTPQKNNEQRSPGKTDEQQRQGSLKQPDQKQPDHQRK